MLKYLAKMAAKNLWRQRRRTFLTFIAISVGLMSYILTDSIMLGVDQMAIDNLKSFQTGDVQVYAAGYFEERESLPLDYSFDAEAASRAVERVPGVVGSTPRLSFSALLNNGIDEIPVQAVGFLPERDTAVFSTTEDDYVDGRMPALGEFGAAVGKNLAELLELRKGDYVTLVTRTKSGAFQALDLEVVGLLNTPHPGVNTGSIYVPIDVASEALGMGGEATELDIRLDPSVGLDEALIRVQNALNSAGVTARAFSWEESAAGFLSVSQAKRAFGAVFLFMILLIATVGIVNTVLLGAIERTTEIGMLKAMGMKEGEIVREFMLEATGIGLLGSGTGVFLGALGTYWMVNYGYDISSLAGDIDFGYPIADAIYGAWNWGTMAVAFVFGIVICWIASYIPARKAAAMDPIRALRRG